MKRYPAAALFAIGLLATEAKADSHVWGGASGRFEVDVWRLGFDEGAGSGGWTEHGARTFASFAKRFNAMIPKGSTVVLRSTPDEPETVLQITTGTREEIVVVPEGPDYDAALAIVAKRFGVKQLPAAGPVKLYTIQLFATGSESRARKFARDVDQQGVRVSSFYYEACLPCAVPVTRVLGSARDGLYRVVTGVFDQRRAAIRSHGQLREQFGLEGFVREI